MVEMRDVKKKFFTIKQIFKVQELHDWHETCSCQLLINSYTMPMTSIIFTFETDRVEHKSSSCKMNFDSTVHTQSFHWGHVLGLQGIIFSLCWELWQLCGLHVFQAPSYQFMALIYVEWYTLHWSSTIILLSRQEIWV